MTKMKSDIKYRDPVTGRDLKENPLNKTKLGKHELDMIMLGLE